MKIKAIVLVYLVALSFTIPAYADLNPYQDQVDAASQNPAAVLGERRV